MSKPIKFNLGILWLLAWLVPVTAIAQTAMPVETVTLVTEKGSFDFRTEIADTDATRSRGLMFRQTMAPDHAMLFDWGGPHTASMWMENTFISLDMLFIGADGTVKHIAQATTPQSRDIISAGYPVRAVLEVIAGTARRIGLKTGDKAVHRLFGGQ